MNRNEIIKLLTNAVTCAKAGDFVNAQRLGEVLIRKLELAGVFKAGAVQVDNPQTLWLHAGPVENSESKLEGRVHQ
jgi:hypothetical protein